MRLPNPRPPPDNPIADISEPEPGSPITAIILGLVVSIGGSLFFGIICGAIYGASLAASGASPEQIVIAAYRIQPDSWVFIACTGIGFIFSILGGYICAKISRQPEYRFGLILASLAALLDFLMSVTRYSFVLSALLGVAGFAFVLVGVRLGRAKNAKR